MEENPHNNSLKRKELMIENFQAKEEQINHQKELGERKENKNKDSNEKQEDTKKENIIKEELKDTRTITNEIIDIINRDKYKKYKIENLNELKELKIINTQNFSEHKLLIDSADLLKIKTLKFENISTSYFNDLLTENSIISKRFKQFYMPIDIKDNLPEEGKFVLEELQKHEKISLEEIIFKNCDIDIDFSNIFPIIKKFRILNCQLPFNLHYKLNFNFLTHLILENIGLINENFEHLFFQIRANINLRKNLKIISVKNNKIGIVDLTKGIPDNQIILKVQFPELEILDFSNNKIFFFSKKIINAIKKIKIIDLTNNNIAFPFGYNTLIEAGKKNCFLLLINKNYGLMRENHRQEYINYLFDIIPRYDYPLRNLPLINLYVGSNYNKMKELNLSKFNNSLIELNLSYGDINNGDFIFLLKNNIALYNLKKLNLTKNKLTDELFDLLLENNFETKFLKLKELNLSGNPVNFKKASNFQNFCEKFKSIKSLIIKRTKFELCINIYMKNKINRYYEKERYKQYKTDFTKEDLEIQKIIDNNHYLSKKTNLTLYIYDTNNYKYVSKIKKFYPEILDKIDIETRFFDPK